MIVARCAGWIALIAVTVVWGRHLLDRGVRLAIGAAPLVGSVRVANLRPMRSIPIAFAVAVVVVGPWIAARVPWSRLVLAGCAVSRAVGRVHCPASTAAVPLFSPFFSPDYLQTAKMIHDPHVFLSQFVQRIHSYNSHARGHPPGMELLLVGRRRASAWKALAGRPVLALAGGAAAGAAALVALRDLAG